MNDQNPLIGNLELPKYDQIKAEHVEVAVRQLVKEAEADLSHIETNHTATWETLIEPLENLTRKIQACWHPVSHLLSVSNSTDMREAYEKVQGDMVLLGLRISQSAKIFEGLKKIQNSASWTQLTRAQQRVIENQIRDNRLSGIELTGEAKDQFNAISKELSKLAQGFSNNVMDATKDFSLTIENIDDVKGMPFSFLSLASQSWNQKSKEQSSTPEKGPWLVTLDYPSFGPFLQHGPNRELREKVYRSSVTKASKGKFDNSHHITKILELKSQLCSLLGYSTYAEMSVASKMAPDVDAVEKLLNELRDASRKPSRDELAELQKFAKTKGLNDDLKPWDVPYYSEQLRTEKFDYSEDEVRQYFQYPVVLEGLFSLVKLLFNVKIEKETKPVEVWHKDVAFYNVLDADGQKIAAFYIDPYSRPENKRGGAWMNVCIDRGQSKGNTITPVAYLVCNNTPPVGNNPSLMTFREVETLFHEFGHGLQHMLTTVDHVSVAGINGVEWDAVELPSQFMENWCYHKDTLMGLTKHIETNKKLPDELFDKISSARTFLSASAMVRQLLFGLVDIELHHRYTPSKSSESVFEVNQRIAKETLALVPLPEDRFLCSFSHIFAGGYSAGYYSYKWAEVLSADAFSAFEETGLKNDDEIRKMGHKFKETVLSLGGGEDPMKVFKAFRGREPKTEPLLRHSGLL